MIDPIPNKITNNKVVSAMRLSQGSNFSDGSFLMATIIFTRMGNTNRNNSCQTLRKFKMTYTNEAHMPANSK